MIPRATNIVVSNHLPRNLREALVEASKVEWPQVPLGESLPRTLAIDNAIRRGRSMYPGLFKPQ